MAKSKLRLKARELRREGQGIKTIAHALEVSSSTVSLWCRDIELTAEQIVMLELRAKDPFYGKRLKYLTALKEKNNKHIQELREKGILDVGTLTERELFVGGICLYWAEGFKKDNQMGFSNSDPTMIRFYITWLEHCCKISKDRLKLRVGVNECYKNKINEIQLFWSEVLNIPISQFQKPFFQKVTWKKVYDNPSDYHGVLRVRVSKSSELLRTMFGWIEGVKNN